MLLRYLAAAAPGILMTLALLLSMQALIDFGSPTGPITRAIPLPVMLGRIQEPVPVVKDTMPERINPPIAPPVRSNDIADRGTGTGVFIGKGISGPDAPVFGKVGIFKFTDGPLVHVVRVRPVYPSAGIRLGLEGHVTVQFDVTTEGQVSNLMVVESSHALFESAAVKAAQKFRFKPKVLDGVPVPATGITYRFRFDIDD